MQPGIDELLRDPERRRPLAGKRLALLGHPASLTTDGRHTLDALMDCPDIRLTAAFGPQHGMRGDKQDNMIESTDYLDPRHGIPVFSLYGAVRYPTDAMLDTFDVLLVDLQDIGTRIYTYVTTLAYLLEACAAKGKALWVLDRPNPAGRPVEGSLLEPGWESFVGAAPMIMRHGLTFGELALWLAPPRAWRSSWKWSPWPATDRGRDPAMAGPCTRSPGSIPAPMPPASIWPVAFPAPCWGRGPRYPKDAEPARPWS